MNKMHQSIAVLVLVLVGLVGCDYETRQGVDANPARVAEMQQTLRDLWVGHIFWVRHVVSNIATNDPEERDAAEIADFLSHLNPYLQRDTVRSLVATHGAHHVLQINQYKTKDYAPLGATWPMMRQHIYVIADTLTTALAKQFPSKFS